MKKRSPYKLNPQQREGPYEVRRRLFATVYLIGKPGQKQTQIVYVSCLAPVVQWHPDLMVPKLPLTEVAEPTEVPEEEIPHRQIPDQSSEEVRIAERSQSSHEPSRMAGMPDLASPVQQTPVGFAPKETSPPGHSCPARQRRQP